MPLSLSSFCLSSPTGWCCKRAGNFWGRISHLVLAFSALRHKVQRVYPVVWVRPVGTCGWQRWSYAVHSSRCVRANCLDQFFFWSQEAALVSPPPTPSAILVHRAALDVPSKDFVSTCSSFRPQMTFLKSTAALDTFNNILRLLAQSCKTWSWCVSFREAAL